MALKAAILKGPYSELRVRGRAGGRMRSSRPGSGMFAADWSDDRLVPAIIRPINCYAHERRR